MNVTKEDIALFKGSALARFFERLRTVRLSDLNQWGAGERNLHKPSEAECDTHLHVQPGVIGDTLNQFRQENHLTIPGSKL